MRRDCKLQSPIDRKRSLTPIRGWVAQLSRTGIRWGLAIPGLMLSGGGCTAARPVHVVPLARLEAAEPAETGAAQRIVVSNPEALRDVIYPLGKRCGLIAIRGAADWMRLREAAPELQVGDETARGTLIGVALWAGTPLDGRWPVRAVTIRTSDGGALAEYTLAGGTYRPDGVTYLDVVFVPSAKAVLVVDINGVRFYLDEGAPAMQSAEAGAMAPALAGD